MAPGSVGGRQRRPPVLHDSCRAEVLSVQSSDSGLSTTERDDDRFDHGAQCQQRQARFPRLHSGVAPQTTPQ